jgi:uncharacterized membrane protein
MSEDAALGCAVIAQAFMDATGQSDSGTTVLEIRDAWLFLTAETGPWAASREHWAMIAGTDASYIRRKALARIAEHDAIMHRLNDREEARQEAREAARASWRAGREERRLAAAAMRAENPDARPRGVKEYLEMTRIESEARAANYARIAVRFIEGFIGLPGPSLAQMAEHLGLNSKQTAAEWLKREPAASQLSWRGKKHLTWRLADGRETLPAREKVKSR